MIVMGNGKVFEKDLLDKLAKKIIKTLAEEGLSIDEAKVVLRETEERITATSKVTPIDS